MNTAAASADPLPPLRRSSFVKREGGRSENVFVVYAKYEMRLRRNELSDDFSMNCHESGELAG